MWSEAYSYLSKQNKIQNKRCKCKWTANLQRKSRDVGLYSFLIESLEGLHDLTDKLDVCSPPHVIKAMYNTEAIPYIHTCLDKLATECIAQYFNSKKKHEWLIYIELKSCPPSDEDDL